MNDETETSYSLLRLNCGGVKSRRLFDAVRASFHCSMWTLDRGAYVAVKRTYQQQLALKKRRLVDSVELLAPLSAENRSVLADALQVAPVRKDQVEENV